MQRSPLAIALALCFTPLASHAQSDTQRDALPLQEIVVTATRTARTADASLAAVSVVTRRDIERLQATSVPELLAGLPGITFSRNGGAGKSASLFLRGAESDHVVVLLDGVKLGSATTGQTAFQDLPVDLIERIEIVRGPLSSLYGSEAIGGVIQIFTKRGRGEAQPDVSVSAGRYGTRQGRAALSGGGEDYGYSVAAAYFHDDGFSAQNGTETDRDGARNASINLRGQRRLGADTEIEAHLMHANAATHYDGSFQNESESLQQALGVTLKHRFSDLWNTRLSLGQSRDESDSFLNGVLTGRYDTRRGTLSWQNDLNLGERRTLTLGADHQDDRVDSTTAYTVSQRDNTGLYAQLQAAAGAHDLRLSLRHDQNSQFGGHLTGNAAWGMRLADGLAARLGYGTAFKAPTFNELYFPGFGNPALLPEKSSSLEAGLSGRHPLGVWSATVFDSRISDLISFDGTTNPSNATARILGLEAETRLILGNWEVKAQATLQDPENRSNTANQGKKLSRRASESLRIDLDRDYGPWRVGATLRGEGKRYDNLANTTRLPGYGLIDLRTETRLAKDWTLAGKIENLFDKRYYTVAGYNQPGAGLYLTLRWQPKK
ncbi:MAG: TonB-dependent vitamin B12 receptor [Betaproteobacteria bacterium]|nr:TonB-dependent vitamin B12 receptor [Betaproteobacteria bacterium]